MKHAGTLTSIPGLKNAVAWIPAKELIAGAKLLSCHQTSSSRVDVIKLHIYKDYSEAKGRFREIQENFTKPSCAQTTQSTHYSGEMKVATQVCLLNDGTHLNCIIGCIPDAKYICACQPLSNTYNFDCFSF